MAAFETKNVHSAMAAHWQKLCIPQATWISNFKYTCVFLSPKTVYLKEPLYYLCDQENSNIASGMIL